MLLSIIIWSVDDPYFFFAFGMGTQNGSKMRKGLTLKICMYVLTVTKLEEKLIWVFRQS